MSGISLDRANGRGGVGSQTAADPPATLGEPWRADCGYCDILTLQALSSSFKSWHTAKRGYLTWAKERLLSHLRQSVPQNGRVHLLGIEFLNLWFAKHMLGVLSHHLKCEMKSPHLVDFSWDLVDFLSNLGRILAEF